ncbi:hypothetical protein TUMEXPCC7403_08990 [Tumidithrix helvetica PCC 7403]
MRTSLSCDIKWRLLDYGVPSNSGSYTSRSLDRIADTIVNTRHPYESDATKKIISQSFDSHSEYPILASKCLSFVAAIKLAFILGFGWVNFPK